MFSDPIGNFRGIKLAGWCLVLATLLPWTVQAASGGRLSMEDAQARALAFNPRLQAADLGRSAALARRDQAGRRPNPHLNLEVENLAGSGEFSGLDGSEWVLSVSQVFDLSGKRQLVQELFSEQIALHDQDRQSAMLDLHLEVGLAFAEVWFAQEALVLAREQTDLAVQLSDEITARLAAGGSSRLELTRARAGIATAQIGVIQAEESLRTASSNLTALWGSETPDFEAVVMPTAFWDQPPFDPDRLSIAENPGITRWDHARAVQGSRLKRARAETGLDVELALGLKLDNATGDKAFVFAAGLPLPVSDRNGDEVRAIGYELERNDKLKQQAVTSAMRELARNVASQTSAGREMSIMAGEIIPLARQAYEETLAAHKRGLYSLTDVLETRRNLFELNRAALESKLRFFAATVRIARLVGHPTPTAGSLTLEEK